MKTLARSMGVAALILTGFAIVGTGLVVVTYSGTKDIIAEAQRAALEASLNQLVPADRYDNRVTEDRIEVVDPEWLGTDQPVTVYRARRNGQPVALFATPVAPDGYSGDINLLVGIDADGNVTGVRVTAHRETPGLGDYIDRLKSDWIEQFRGKSLGDPEAKYWKVAKDGGRFDARAGATITPRAVVKAVKGALDYFARHRAALLSAPPPGEEP
jgi:electron transport complex protein RnfG